MVAGRAGKPTHTADCPVTAVLVGVAAQERPGIEQHRVDKSAPGEDGKLGPAATADESRCESGLRADALEAGQVHDLRDPRAGDASEACQVCHRLRFAIARHRRIGTSKLSSSGSRACRSAPSPASTMWSTSRRAAALSVAGGEMRKTRSWFRRAGTRARRCAAPDAVAAGCNSMTDGPDKRRSAQRTSSARRGERRYIRHDLTLEPME